MSIGCRGIFQKGANEKTERGMNDFIICKRRGRRRHGQSKCGRGASSGKSTEARQQAQGQEEAATRRRQWRSAREHEGAGTGTTVLTANWRCRKQGRRCALPYRQKAAQRRRQRRGGGRGGKQQRAVSAEGGGRERKRRNKAYQTGGTKQISDKKSRRQYANGANEANVTSVNGSGKARAKAG